MFVDLTPDELLSTTRSVRKRLDLERGVERSVVEECLRLAFQAPTGTNHQDWGWIVVEDASIRHEMAALYRQGLADHAARSVGDESVADQRTEAGQRIGASVAYLVEHLHEVPMLLVPTIGPLYGESTSFAAASRWGSILPAVWSFMLALRSRGLGSAWTTLHLYREHEMAELLGIPEGQRQAGLFPIAYTIGTEFRPADRSASEDRIFWDAWGRR
ncbi:MAG: nitroreductase family protein [Acidimicrobiales bacterium]|nr:nitroreductase family protein [Acidimicrobiales bacterium]